MTITLRQMRYADAVARTGHFGRAAEACAVSQPALSQQIMALEALCGTPLFDRLKSGVQLTPFGRDFIALAQTTLRSAEALDAFALGRSGRPNRHIRFGLIPTVAPYLLPAIFPALRQQLAGVDFAVSESRTDSLLAGLADGSLDVALIATPLPERGPRLVSVPLFLDRFVLATSRDEAASAPVQLDALAPDRILLLDEGHCFRDQAIAACRIQGSATPRTFAATSLSTIVEFVANGQGVTLLPQIAVPKEAGDARIAVHPIASTGAERMLSLVWRDGAPFAALFERMAQTIRATQKDAA